jgi:hypothetical protein
MSPRRKWYSPKSQPLSRQRVCPSPQNRGEGGTLGEGLGESQFRRLEKKLSTLPTLWYCVSVPPWMKEVKGIILYIEGGGPTYAARSLPLYISAFATRVLLSTYVCVKGERA